MICVSAGPVWHDMKEAACMLPMLALAGFSVNMKVLTLGTSEILEINSPDNH
jgi:hypothetical protein